MASTVTPTNQIISLDPYDGKLFDFDTTSSRVYLSRYINTLLRVLGTDLILDGLLIKSINYNHNTNLITIVVSSGKCIADCTLIEFPTDLTLTLDVTPYDTGYLFITIHYQFLETIFSNLSKLKLFHATLDGLTISPEEFEANTDRMIVAVLDLNKEEETVTINTDLVNINLLLKSYEIRPLSILAKDSLNYLKKMIVCQ